MRKLNTTKRQRLLAEINVVPYIDVMLVLLVIFMVTTPLLTQGVKVNLPQAQANPLKVKQQEPLIITVDQAGRYYLNTAAKPTKPLAPATLATRIAAELQLAHQQHSDRRVLIKGDEDVNYGKIVQAMVLLQKAGVANVGLMTQNITDNKSAG